MTWLSSSSGSSTSELELSFYFGISLTECLLLSECLITECIN